MAKDERTAPAGVQRPEERQARERPAREKREAVERPTAPIEAHARHGEQHAGEADGA